MHFLRSIYAGNTEAEGFLTDQMNPQKTDTTLFIDIEKHISRTYTDFISLKLNAPLRIFYVTKPVHRDEYKKVLYADIFENKTWSYLTMAVDEAIIDSKGSYLNYKSFLIDGHWAGKRIGDRLPFEYLPE